MASITLTIRDKEGSDSIVTMEGDFGGEVKELTPAIMTVLAIKKLFDDGWIAQNINNIVPYVELKPDESDSN